MPFDNLDYKNLTDYLRHLYACQPFERHGIEHPVTVFYPEDWQTTDVDSVLDVWRPTIDARDFPTYDYAYLHDLLNSKPGLHNGYSFTMRRLSTHPLKLRGGLGRYYDMLATCAALENELREAASQGWMRAPSRTTYHRHLDPKESLLRGLKRCAAIGIGALTVFNDRGTYKAMLARRSEKTAYDSGMFHVLPAMMFGPTTASFSDEREWSVRHQVMREVLEELFNMPEQRAAERWDFFYDHPAYTYLDALMASGRAQLYLTGVIVNLLTLRPEISTLLLIHEPEWYARITAEDSDIPFMTAEETLSQSVITAPIEDDDTFLALLPDDLHLQMPAQATATLWLGIDLAREKI